MDSETGEWSRTARYNAFFSNWKRTEQKVEIRSTNQAFNLWPVSHRQGHRFWIDWGYGTERFTDLRREDWPMRTLLKSSCDGGNRRSTGFASAKSGKWALDGATPCHCNSDCWRTWRANTIRNKKEITATKKAAYKGYSEDASNICRLSAVN